MNRRILLVLVCGTSVGVLPYAADAAGWHHFPMFLEYLFIPGFFFASFAYPQGIHTGGGAPSFVSVSLVLNVLFYCTLIWIIARLLSRRSRISRAA